MFGFRRRGVTPVQAGITADEVRASRIGLWQNASRQPPKRRRRPSSANRPRMPANPDKAS